MDSGLKQQETGAITPGQNESGTWIERTRLAAIVEGSDDAILTKSLDGIITSWNRGAERIFGYTAAETIGRPVTMLIPLDRHDEEPDILARIRRGEHVDHYETIRQHKDGRQIHISLTVSPLRDERGNVVGASKIARDIDDRVHAREQQRMLLGEMHHRIKNVFALTSGLIRLCAARAKTPAEMAQMVGGRLDALARAHALTVPPEAAAGTADARHARLHGLLRALVAPAIGSDEGRASFCGDDIALSPRAMTPLALVLNELVTNASKHGALHDEEGKVDVSCRLDGEQVVLTWREHMKNAPDAPPETSGFGTQLSQFTVEHQLGGSIVRRWEGSGLSVTITFGTDLLE